MPIGPMIDYKFTTRFCTYFFWRFSYFFEEQETNYCFLIFHKSWMSCHDVYHQWESLVMLVVDTSVYLFCPTPMYCDTKSVIRIAFNMILSLCLLFLLPHKWRICLPSHTRFLVFDIWLANFQYFLQLHCEFMGNVRVIYLFSYYFSIYLVIILELLLLFFGAKVN